MLKIKRRTVPLATEGTINRLNMELGEEKERRSELEDAMMELAELYAEQDEIIAEQNDALIELAEIIEEG